MKICVAAGILAVALGLAQDPQKEALRQKLKDTNLTGAWIYDDLGAGFAAAKKTGKPMLVVFR